jgi:hypothetical protein
LREIDRANSVVGDGGGSGSAVINELNYMIVGDVGVASSAAVCEVSILVSFVMMDWPAVLLLKKSILKQ